MRPRITILTFLTHSANVRVATTTPETSTNQVCTSGVVSMTSLICHPPQTNPMNITKKIPTAITGITPPLSGSASGNLTAARSTTCSSVIIPAPLATAAPVPVPAPAPVPVPAPAPAPPSVDEDETQDQLQTNTPALSLDATGPQETLPCAPVVRVTTAAPESSVGRLATTSINTIISQTAANVASTSNIPQDSAPATSSRKATTKKTQKLKKMAPGK